MCRSEVNNVEPKIEFEKKDKKKSMQKVLSESEVRSDMSNTSLVQCVPQFVAKFFKL